MIIIRNFDHIQSDDIKGLREAALREEIAIVELARQSNSHAEEIRKRKIVLRSIKRIIATHEKPKGGQALA